MRIGTSASVLAISTAVGLTPGNAEILAAFRAIAVISWPRLESSAAIRDPTLPDAPISAIFIHILLCEFGKAKGKSIVGGCSAPNRLEGLQDHIRAAVEVAILKNFAMLAERR